MATSYDYVDEFTKQLARKRRLAELLQQQSMSGPQLTNPNARASWLNALAPLAQAYFGGKMADQANAEGTAHQAELAQQTKDAIEKLTQGTQGLPERPDMNLPGDLSGLADATTRPSTDVQSPLLPPAQQPQNPMAQLLAGNATPTLGDKLAADQGAPTVAPKDLTPMLPGTAQPSDAPATPPLVPQPPIRINIGGVSPAQAARDEAIVKADMAKSGLAGSPIVRGPAPPEEQAAATAGEIPPMPPQAPAPPPSLAGPVTPGALPAPPGTPPPSLIPTLPNGQPDMAPKGQMLPAQPGKVPNAFDMLNFAASLPPGQQQQKFMDEALKNSLTEPDRRQAQIERHEARLDRTAMLRDNAIQRSQDMALSREQRDAWQKQALEQKKLHDEQMLEYAKLIHGTGAGGEGKPPSGYRWDRENPGNLVPITGGPADPDTISAKKNAAQIQITGGRESVFTNRVMQAAAQASKDLANIVKVPVEDQTTGILGGRHQGTGLLDATKEVLAQKITPQEAQTYNVMATGLQRALAAVETSGLAQGIQEFSKQIDVVSKEGDTNLTKLHKLAQVRQIIEAGMESILANPRVPDEQKDLVRKTLKGVEASVPFTHSDLIELTAKQAINSDATLKDVLGKTGQTNAKGWRLMTDKNGNKAYVSPDGKQFEEVK